MPGGGSCILGAWIAVFYSKLKVPPVGRIVDIDTSTASATVHFLKGKQMSSGDNQTVHQKYIICKVEVDHDIDSEQILVLDSKQTLEKQRQKYLELC